MFLCGSCVKQLAHALFLKRFLNYDVDIDVTNGNDGIIMCMQSWLRRHWLGGPGRNVRGLDGFGEKCRLGSEMVFGEATYRPLANRCLLSQPVDCTSGFNVIKKWKYGDGTSQDPDYLRNLSLTRFWYDVVKAALEAVVMLV